MRYHHLGIPTAVKREGETYLPQFYRIQWMRFEPDSPLPELVKTIPHVAFQVDDLLQALIGKQVLIEPNSPTEGVRVAFIVDDGAPVELLQIQRIEGKVSDGLEISPVYED
jgi:hypothetical protein